MATYHGTPDYVLDGVGRLLAAVLPLFERTPGGVADHRLYSAYRRAVTDLRRDTRAAARTLTLGENLAGIISAYRRAADDPQAAYDGLERVAVAVRAFQPVTPTSAPKQRQARVEWALAGLIEALAVIQAVTAAAQVTITSREQADILRARVGRLVDVAVERASDHGTAEVQRALVTIGGWVTRELIERGRPLARLVAYETAVPLPAAVLAQKIYADAGRMAEIVAQNANHDHPSFMPTAGKVLSK